MLKQIFYDYLETYDYFLNDSPNNYCFKNEMISLSEEEDSQGANLIYFSKVLLNSSKFFDSF